MTPSVVAAQAQHGYLGPKQPRENDVGSEELVTACLSADQSLIGG